MTLTGLHFRGFLVRSAIAVLAFVAMSVSAFPQNLAITSPANGTVVNPGQTVSVTVESPAGLSFSSVAVAGEGPIGFSNIATSVPAQFSFTIPVNTDCGQYALTADGTTTTGQTFESASVLIDVEHADAAIALSSSLSTLEFRSPGEQSSVSFSATFATNNVVADVTGSSLMSYASSNTSVATVDASTGRLIVTAVGPGTASITATYAPGTTTSLPVSIPVIVSQPLTASPSALTFPPQGVGSSSSPQAITILNSSTATINISAVTATGSFSETDTCAGAQLAVGGTCSINVTFTPVTAGTMSGNITISDNANPSSLTIPLNGTGITDFSISVTPATQSVTLKGSASYTVSVSAIGGFTGTVSLSVGGAPASTTSTFSPTSISGGSGSSNLKIATSSKTPTGTFTLAVTGASGTLTHSVNVTLTVNK